MGSKTIENRGEGATEIERTVARDSDLPKGRSEGEVWVIEARAPGLMSQIREIWRYRYLVRFFGMRALQKRTQRTVLGYWWLLIRPLFPILIGVLVFGGVMGVSVPGVPYFLFMSVGMMQWRLFGTSLMWCTRSLELNRGIMKQLYFPRLVIPIGTMAPSWLTLIIYSIVIAIALTYYLVVEGTLYLQAGKGLLMAVMAILLSQMFALGLGFFTSIAGARTRDLRFSLSYLLNAWMLLTPVMYPIDFIDEQWRWLLYFNPLVALVETFKWGLIGYGELDLLGLGIATVIIALVFGCGLLFFNRAEITSADRL